MLQPDEETACHRAPQFAVPEAEAHGEFSVPAVGVQPLAEDWQRGKNRGGGEKTQTLDPITSVLSH